MKRGLRIATYNLAGLGGRGGGSEAERVRAFRAMLARLDADVLCLQEVDAQNIGTRHHPLRRLNVLEPLLADSPYADFHRSHSQHRDRDGALDIHNLVILSRWPMLQARQIWHELVPPPRHVPLHVAGHAGNTAVEAQPRRWDRPLLYAQIDLCVAGHGPGDSLHVFNAHLRAPLAAHLEGQKLSTGVWRSTAAWAEGFYLAALQRNGQALEMRLAVDRLLSTEPDARVIVCGDLNADLNEMPVRLLCASETDTGNPALAGRALHAVDRALVSTSSEGCDVASRADERHYMLDHVLASKSLAAACTRVWMPVGEPAWPSDHPPLLAVFEI